jgi:menaquinone-dependent protoporphyrinogen oxidase
MTKRILVAYASRAGSTAEVAEAIGRTLRDGGREVDVRPVQELEDLAGYDGLVLGSAIWAGKPLPEALQFATTNRDALERMPVAYFALCEILRDDNPETRMRAQPYLDPLRSIKEPVAAELFAGKKDYSAVHPLLRPLLVWVMVHLFKSPEGDWRDWARIRTWAEEVGARLREAQSG